MAKLSMPVTWPATRIGIPMAPKATGAVLTIRHSPAAYSGLKPSPTSSAAVIATGAPETGGPFEEGAEGEADNQHLQALVRCNRKNRRADNVELPGLYRDFIDEDRGDNNPRDRPQAVEEAVYHRR